MRFFPDCALCYLSVSLSFLSFPLHNKPPLNLSWDPSFAGYSKRQIMLIFHLDSGRWSQVFGSSRVFRCNCAADGTWRAATDEGWGVEDFGKRGTPRPPPSRIHSVNERREKFSFFFPSKPCLLDSASRPVKAMLEIQLLNLENVMITGCSLSVYVKIFILKQCFTYFVSTCSRNATSNWSFTFFLIQIQFQSTLPSGDSLKSFLFLLSTVKSAARCRPGELVQKQLCALEKTFRNCLQTSPDTSTTWRCGNVRWSAIVCPASGNTVLDYTETVDILVA